MRFFAILTCILTLLVITSCTPDQTVLIKKSITNNLGNITINNTYLNQTIYNNITSFTQLNNTSFQCPDTNDVLYNVSIINGLLTGLCHVDSSGGGATGECPSGFAIYKITATDIFCVFIGTQVLSNETLIDASTCGDANCTTYIEVF